MKLAHSLLAGAALAVSLATSATAADLLKPADPIYSSSLFNFEGLYLGGSAGGAIDGGALTGTLGVIAGANFAVTDGIIVGGEFQGDAYWTGGGFTSFDALALGRVGGFISDNTMLYGDLGAGFKGGTAVYAVGGGAEMALSGPLSLRGDLQILGPWGALPSTGRATVGLLWHMN
jgi:opacity protein-like surface antigen